MFNELLIGSATIAMFNELHWHATIAMAVLIGTIAMNSQCNNSNYSLAVQQ